MSFHVGQKVVCVLDDWEPSSPAARRYGMERNFPIRGRFYHVRSIRANADATHIRLHEIINPETEDTLEAEWDAEAFRPVTEKKTDAEVEKLKRFLNPSDRKVAETVE